MVFRRQKNEKGFTLTELLVVITIISLLTVLTFAQYNRGQKSFALQRSAHKLSQDIRRVQEMAMSAKERSGVVPPRYGILFDTDSPDSYKLFSDINDNGTYQPPDEIIETVYLEKGVEINEVFVWNPPSSKTEVFISFKPPDPSTEIRDPGGPRLVVRIQLIIESQTKNVFINKAGLIYVE